MHNRLLQSVYSNGNIQKPAPCGSQTNHQPQDRSTIYRIYIGSVNLTISVQFLQHVFSIVHSVIKNQGKINNYIIMGTCPLIHPN